MTGSSIIAENQTAWTGLHTRTPANDQMPAVLIVEDDEDSRQMLKILLEIWKYRVLEAKDGLEAVSVAESARPDLILMDVKLPKFDGFETTRRLRQSEIIDGVPIIFLSGCAEEIYRRAADAVGGNEYLVKPLDFQLLEITLNKYISRPQTNFRENP